MSKTVAYKFIVSGRVQGVGFRWFVLNLAQELSVSGTVKNVYNGDVEIIAQSDINTLNQFKIRIKQGSAMSRIDSVTEIEDEFNNQLTDFKVIV